uniref:ANK_REP_REGION domain-containing protein n=1 Tax=Macrostomum lignano TaxID=282301 RepID=A0A1I8ID55_9PLAT
MKRQRESCHLRKLAKYTRSGRFRRVSKRLDKMKRSASDNVPDYRDEDGRSLLHLAAAEGHGGLIRTFSELGCSLEAKDVHGNTPVHLILYHCLQTGKS